MFSLSNIFSNLSPTTSYALIAIGVFFALMVAYAYYTHLRVTNAPYNANHESGSGAKIGDVTAKLLFFSADWCPHCKTAKPEWETVKIQYDGKELNGYKLEFQEYDCSGDTPSAETTAAMDTYEVEGYPTIKLLKGDEVITFDAKPTYDLITAFLTTVL